MSEEIKLIPPAPVVRDENGFSNTPTYRTLTRVTATSAKVADTLEADGQFCTLGVLSAKRSIEMSVIDAHCRETVSGAFRIAPAMAAEVVFESDECGWNETPEQRWQRMRKWVDSQIKEVTP